jgi:acyl-CoA thioester hydrolase
MTHAPATDPRATEPRAPRPARSAFVHFTIIATRWHDNDAYGHVNNVVYYAFFDTAVNRFLVERGLLSVQGSEVIGLVAETGCRYFEPLAFPEPVEVGLAIEHLGEKSVRYALGVFRAGAEAAAAAGHFVHVHVDRASGRPVAIPAATRAVLEGIVRARG